MAVTFSNTIIERLYQAQGNVDYNLEMPGYSGLLSEIQEPSICDDMIARGSNLVVLRSAPSPVTGGSFTLTIAATGPTFTDARMANETVTAILRDDTYYNRNIIKTGADAPARLASSSLGWTDENEFVVGDIVTVFLGI